MPAAAGDNGRENMNAAAITEASKVVFLGYAKDSENWSGNIPVFGTAEHRGNLTQLKIAGLVKTWNDEGRTWLQFTPAGKEFAKTLGIEI